MSVACYLHAQLYNFLAGLNFNLNINNNFTWCSVAFTGGAQLSGQYDWIYELYKIIVIKMANCNCECASVSLETVNFEPPSDESSETNEKQDDGSRKRKRRKKRMLTGVSRQRRAANARERRRIQGVNRAFVQLKNTLPLAQIDISKFEILHLAVKWIDHLRTLLEDHEERKELLNTKQLETSRPNEFVSLDENMTPVKHDCLYHQFPDLKNTLWEECIGLHGKCMVHFILYYILFSHLIHKHASGVRNTLLRGGFK